MFSTLINHKSVEIIIDRMQISRWLIEDLIDFRQNVQLVGWAFEKSQALSLKEDRLRCILGKYLINFCNPLANLIFLLALNVEVAEDLTSLYDSLKRFLRLNSDARSLIVASIDNLLDDFLVG